MLDLEKVKELSEKNHASPLGYVDEHGNIELVIHQWMINEPNVIWQPFFSERELKEAYGFSVTN